MSEQQPERPRDRGTRGEPGQAPLQPRPRGRRRPGGTASAPVHASARLSFVVWATRWFEDRTEVRWHRSCCGSPAGLVTQIAEVVCGLL